MKLATQGQRDCLLAKLLTGVDSRSLSHERVQAMLKDECLGTSFARFVNTYEASTEVSSKLFPGNLYETLPDIAEFDANREFIESYRFGLQIVFLNNEFKEWFGRKVEKNIKGIQARSWVMLDSLYDKFVLDELKGRAEIALAHVYGFLKECRDDREICYLFFVRDTSNVLRTLVAYQSASGWSIRAGSVDSGPGSRPGREIHVGYCVISR